MCKHCDLSKKERKLQEEVISEAMRLLLKTFGIRVIEPEQKKGTYYLINALTEPQEDEDQQHITWSDKENAQLGLTFVILGVVFMSNGKISEENLFKFLKHLGIYEEDRNKKRGGGDSSYADSQVDAEITELFDGDVKKFVTDILVSRQHYLKKERVETGDPEAEAYEYSWGERAKLEVKESSILMMVCELYECEPRMFKEQFDKVSLNLCMLYPLSYLGLWFMLWCNTYTTLFNFRSLPARERMF